MSDMDRQHGRRSVSGSGLILIAALVIASMSTGGTPAFAQAPSVDILITRLFNAEEKEPYELTADFTGSLALVVRGARLAIVAAGSFLEWRSEDGVKRRKVTIKRLDLPLLLRPFAGPLRQLIEERVETQSETPETFHAHDVFLLNELPERRYTLVGVHRSIVDEMFDRFGRPEDKQDTATRRKIAQWLYTSPSMRDSIVRPGPPYALRAVVDEAGVLYELTLFYNWGEVGTRIAYVFVNGQPVWQQVASDAVSELGGIGRVDGELLLTFTNHCVNCRRP